MKPDAIRRFLSTLVMLCLHGAASAASCVEPPADPLNTYDAQHTYAKLVRDYPAIRIASAALPVDVNRIADLTYAQYGERCLKLDLYLPLAARADGGMPVVVLVHGGGWRAGFRSEFAPMAVRLAQHGYAAVAISYRLSGEAAYPAAIDDTQAAVRWVRDHAGLYHLNPQRIALAGGSAGGQIASLAGVTGRLDSAVQAIVNIDGLSDFTAEAALKYEDDPAKQPSAAGAWFGGRYAEKSALWAEASPIRYVRAGMPPILFIASAQPRFSVGREAMAAAMAQAGVASSTLVLPDTPHSFWLFDPWLQTIADATVAFLTQQMPQR
ncbi:MULTISPECIES: alpha/beta hydrolase [unclassified Duganella]|uniref:alpha/beta hydrolase n=1 Tax=unclassified Duganella TaxID=2636909 RepID=UPI000E3550E3|nr:MULTISPECIES: alpha/beta hydrolase [unclassified Duganella]RFP18797.1 alpha/beta hydrolase [Duganella sp. BJB475]RFP35462.1 alpha/beta hydrolase [Duganella sp. BJB476]